MIGPRSSFRPSANVETQDLASLSTSMNTHPKMIAKLLWIDGLGGAVAGAVVLLVGSWLSAWYQLPRDLLILMGVANLGYGMYSLSLARRSIRPKNLILLLIVANFFWAVVCVRLAVAFAQTASWLGLAHLVGEALLVGGLASVEWRFREQLRIA